MTIRFTCTLTALLMASMLRAQSDATPPQPPVANRIDHRETRQGAVVVDNYFWLREKQNPEVSKYLQAENAYTAAMTKDLKPFETRCTGRCWRA